MTFQLNEHDNSDMSRKKLVSHSVNMLFILIFVLFNLSFCVVQLKCIATLTIYNNSTFPKPNSVTCIFHGVLSSNSSMLAYMGFLTFKPLLKFCLHFT